MEFSKKKAFFTKGYLILLTGVLITWAAYMQISGSWSLMPQNIPIMLTMVLGSFIAGVSAEGGGAVAFPIFTKILHIAPVDARNFGLLIQSVGMGMAAFYIYSNKMKVLWKVIIVVSIGGIFGQLFGAFFLNLSGSMMKILFTIISSMLGLAMILMRWVLRMPVYEKLSSWDFRHSVLFLLVGFAGGCFASQTSSGIDMLCFIFLVILFGINEKTATLSSVVIMGFNAMVGAFVHAFLVQDISIASYEAWLCAIPIVVFGAPLGSFISTRINRDAIIILLISIITIEFISTLILVPINPVFGILVALTTLVFFAALILIRRRNSFQV